MLHQLNARQWLNRPLAEVWAFISDPNNLARITPPDMKFQVLTQLEHRPIYPGQFIEYKISPVLGIPLHWVTEITQVQPRQYFVDEQRTGPYVLWHHQHFLREADGGVEMTDLVHYQLPLGLLSRLANRLFVQRQLETIFRYRYQQLELIFNSPGKGV